MPVAVFREDTQISIGKRITFGGRVGILVGVNGDGTVRVRFFDNQAEDELVDPTELSLTVEAL